MATHLKQLLTPEVQWFAAVDGGGSRTRVRVWNREGVLHGGAEAGPSGLGQGSAQAWKHIGEALAAVADAVGEPIPASQLALALGLAGVNNADWRGAFLATNPGYAMLDLYSDAETALAGAHGGGPGILLIAGTGSIAMARADDGTIHSVGGWGFPVGDEGSGAALGLQAMRLTQQAIDGRRVASPLTNAVRSATGSDAVAILDWCGRSNQFHYATLAPLVFAHADADARAAELLSDAVFALQAMVAAVDPTGTLPLAIAGSVAQQLVPRLPPPLAARLASARGDALDGAFTLFQQALSRRTVTHQQVTRQGTVHVI